MHFNKMRDIQTDSYSREELNPRPERFWLKIVSALVPWDDSTATNQ